MKNTILLSLVFLVSCAQVQRTPSSEEETAVFVEFTDSGMDAVGKMYTIEGQISSNHLREIRSAEIVIKDEVIKEIKIIEKENEFFIKAKVRKKLPIESTKIRFHFISGESKDVDLVCTRPGRCF